MLNLKKRLKKLRKQINLFVFLCIGSLVLSNTFADNEFWLLTETEYALLDVENSIDEKLNYSLNTGPKINLVSPNIIDASFKALVDSLDYKLFKDNAPAST